MRGHPQCCSVNKAGKAVEWGATWRWGSWLFMDDPTAGVCMPALEISTCTYEGVNMMYSLWGKTITTFVYLHNLMITALVDRVHL